MQKQIHGKTDSFNTTIERLRNWARRIMPTIALVAAVLFILRTILGSTFLFGDNLIGALLRTITSLSIFLTFIYYGFKLLRLIKRKLFWRVRRRLLITYLFVGVTPIILLSGLGFLFFYGLALNSMSASVMSQVEATQHQALETARILANELAMLPSRNDESIVKKWLDERNTLIQSSLPGAQIVVWRGNDEKAFREDTKLTSEISSEKTIGIGDGKKDLGEKLPNWLKGQELWSGLTYTLAQQEGFGSPSIRAIVNRKQSDSSITLLLTVPINQVLVERYRENTNLYVRPFFVSSASTVEADEKGVRIQRPNVSEAGDNTNSQKDQFGETISGAHAWVVMRATNWQNGETNQHVTFVFPSSPTDVKKHFSERGYLGQAFDLNLVLKVFGIVFLILEGTALIAAVFMTRAVTIMVHRLYRATKYIKLGDFSHRIRTSSYDQLGELANAFNDMSSHIETLLQERVERERLQREVEIAAQVQSRLFPEKVPDLLSVEIAAECRAASGVAGDYYDYIEVLPGLVALALADVSGKGMSASLVMSNLQASLRSQAAITAERLSIAARAAAASTQSVTDRALMRVMADAAIDGAVARKCFNINKQLCQSTEDNRFATLFLALYEDRTRKLRYTNAGHNAPILIRTDGSHERLSTGGLMIGAFDFSKYEEGALTINPDDILLIFSDGISEAESEQGKEYGENRLLNFIIENRSLSAHQLRDAIFCEMDKWAGTKERGDDQTILILKGCD